MEENKHQESYCTKVFIRHIEAPHGLQPYLELAYSTVDLLFIYLQIATNGTVLED